MVEAGARRTAIPVVSALRADRESLRRVAVVFTHFKQNGRIAPDVDDPVFSSPPQYHMGNMVARRNGAVRPDRNPLQLRRTAQEGSSGQLRSRMSFQRFATFVKAAFFTRNRSGKAA